MITFIILGIIAILAFGVIALVWGSGARKRAGQSEIPSERATTSSPKVGRASGPD